MLREREDEVVDELRESLQDLPAIDYKFSRPALFSFKTPIEVVIQGYNLQVLKMNADRIKEYGRAGEKSEAVFSGPPILLVSRDGSAAPVACLGPCLGVVCWGAQSNGGNGIRTDP